MGKKQVKKNNSKGIDNKRSTIKVKVQESNEKVATENIMKTTAISGSDHKSHLEKGQLSKMKTNQLLPLLTIPQENVPSNNQGKNSESQHYPVEQQQLLHQRQYKKAHRIKRKRVCWKIYADRQEKFRSEPLRQEKIEGLSVLQAQELEDPMYAQLV